MTHVRRRVALILGLAATAALAACGGFQSAGSGPAAEAPTYRVGDRWVYHGQDGFRLLTTWEETHTISAVGADGIGERITVKGPTLDLARSRAMGGARSRQGRRPLRERDASLRDAARSLPVSARRGRDVEPVRRQFRREHEGDRADQQLRPRPRLGDGRHARRHVRRDRHARRDVARRRGPSGASPRNATTPCGTHRRCAASCGRSSRRSIRRRAATWTAARGSAPRTP